MAGVGEEPAVTYSLKFQSRALASVPSSKLVSTWVVGTNALREENEYDADQERLVCSKALVHKAEVWDVCVCPTTQDLLLTVWSQAGTPGVTLWSAAGADRVESVAELSGHTSQIRRAVWHASSAELAVTLEESALRTWAIADGRAAPAGHGAGGELLQLWSVALQPQGTTLAATAGGNNVQLWDLRSMAISGELVGAHRMPVRDVAFSPADEHRLVSAGDDCKIRIWDTRTLGKAEPLMELGGHTHWVWRAQFCPFHEQLLASSSSDCLVNLYHLPALARRGGGGGGTGSARLPPAGESAPGKQAPLRVSDLDGRARSYDEHEDSVYGLAWSAADPWLFASLSYDGRVVVTKVPKNIKFKIIV